MSERRSAYLVAAGDTLTVEQLYEHLDQSESEASFQRWVESLARVAGCVTYHARQVAVCECCRSRRCSDCAPRMYRVIARGSNPGWPDLVIGRADPPLLIIPELKTRVGRVTPEQAHWLAILRANGVRAEVWRPADRAMIERSLRGDWRDG